MLRSIVVLQLADPLLVPPMLRSLVVLQLADPLLLLQLAEHVRIQALHFDMAQFHPTTWEMQGWLGRRCSALHQYQWVEHEHVVRRSALVNNYGWSTST